MGLVHHLADKYPKFGRKAFDSPNQELFDYCAVVLNGTFLSASDDQNTELEEGDSVKLSPAFYGG